MAYVPYPLEGAFRAVRQRRERAREERGVVLAFCALFITTLVGLGGFSVDIGNWYLHIQRLQRAADSAALAGSIYLPNDFPSAKATALDNLARNGAPLSSYDISQSTLHPTILTVTVRETVPNYFISVFGYKEITFGRSASAEFSPYVPMGSPSNLLGVEYNPLDTWQKSSTKGKQDRYWLNISGPSTAKSTGDRYSSGNCDSNTSNCNAGGSIPTKNLDYTDGEQIFVVRVPTTVEGNLVIQAFDPVFAHVGDNCDSSTLTSGIPSALLINPILYASNNTPQCTGDNIQGSGPAPNMKFELWTPELSDGGTHPVTNPTCQAANFTGEMGNIGPRINSDATFASAFRKWTQICKMYVDGDTDAGDYLLHVKVTNGTANGLNRYALRIGIITGTLLDTTQTNQLQLFSKGRLVVYARDNSGSVTFYLARINSAAAGHTMTVTLFDIGDAAGGASLQLLPAEDAKDNGSPLTQYTGCTYTPPGQSIYQPMGSGCSITGITSASYNGKLVNIKVPIPVNYSCEDANPDKCWNRLALTYGAGSTTDTTSWEVGLDGNPVHLVTG